MQRKRNTAKRRVCALALLFTAAPVGPAGASERPFSAEIGGRLHLDFADFGNDDRGPPNRNATEVRRAWLDVSGRLYSLRYKVEGDFSDSHDVVARDVFLSQRFGEAGTLTLGQFKQPFSLDDRTGSNYGSFLERGSAAGTLAPLYRLGAGWLAAARGATFAASAYSLQNIDVTAAKGYGLASRLTWSTAATERDVLHLGLSLASEYHDRPGAPGRPALKIRPRPAGHLSDNSRITLVDFSAGRDTRVHKWSLEYAAVHGPLSWQAEWSGARLRDGLQHGQAQAAYVLLSWFVSGQSRRYDAASGRFTRIGGIASKWGAVELAARYDTMWGSQSLDDGPVLRSGRTEAFTLGANWYLRPNLRLMFNLIHSRNLDRLSGTTLDRTRALTGRLQYDF
ncbi:MAG TPA: porin [Stenotrophomonas sp.]|nr:porin [Stenotrophomonas sp.]